MIAKPTGQQDFTAPLSDVSRNTANLRVCEVLHEARAKFELNMVTEAAIEDKHFARQMLQQPIYQMVEFFYLTHAFQLDSAVKIRRYAELHNIHLEALQTDHTRISRMGLTLTRVRQGIFPKDCILKLVENYSLRKAALDQSDLSRFLIETMSRETCRKTVLVLTRAGYLERERSPYKSILVRSTGVMESLFTDHLEYVRSRLQDECILSTPPKMQAKGSQEVFS